MTIAQRTALFIAYHYPPARTSGTERTTKFQRHLPACGYRIRVLTTAAFGPASEAETVQAWEPLALYRRLFGGKGDSGSIASQQRTDPGLLKGLVNWLRRTVFIPDLQITWLPAALWRGLMLLRRQPIDILYSTYPPASGHLLGLALSRLTRIPWVADFRDAWIYDPLDPALTQMPWRRRLEKRLERAVVLRAGAVIAATQVTADYLKQAYPQRADRIHVITNGFEPDEFPPCAPPPTEGPLQLVHTGAFSYSHPQRTPLPLFAACQALLAEDPAWARRLRLVLVGPLSLQERQAVDPLVQAGLAKLTGPLDRAAALAQQRRAHVLLLVDHPRPWPASNVPGKFYEYLALRRPVLALCGVGMVRQLIEELGAGIHAPPDQPESIRQALVDMYQRHQDRRLPQTVDEQALQRFHRRRLTAALARCFDGLVEAAPTAPRHD
ncbi:MAG: glycosyltransferase [Candidatus Latescibacteria bacterium]|nr:glycosyltransferase [Candidatus Latescibacterota bacterium]